MSDVPDELLPEILSRLPVAPLLRFRCVSKSWKDLIDSQEFIKHHLNHSRNTNSNLNIVLPSEHQLYSADFDLLNEINMVTFKQLSHPLNTPSSGFTNILGSCDGLLVLRNYEYDITILWNPSVKRFRVIPSCNTSIEKPQPYKITHGFGHDVVSDDYKLISIAEFYGKDGELNSEVKVYSLKSDSWRTIPDFPYHLRRAKTKGVLANGALHWIVIGKVKFDQVIAAFDLGTEEYRLIPLPKFVNYDKITCLTVAVLGGCLSLMCYVNMDRDNLWVMKEYGVEESWSLLFSYDNPGAMMRPLAYSKCGRKMLLSVANANVLRWYDLDKKSIDEPMVQMPLEKSYGIYTCLQSLVLLNSSANDFDLVVEMMKHKKDKKGRSIKRKYVLA